MLLGACQGAGGTAETGLLEWEEQQPQGGGQLQLSREKVGSGGYARSYVKSQQSG